MAGDIGHVDQTMVMITQQHQVGDISFQLLRKNGISARPIRAIGNNVSYICIIKLMLGHTIQPKGCITILATSSRFSPKPEYNISWYSGNRHGWVTFRNDSNR